MTDRGASPELYRMSTFSKLTGVSPDLLRAWERRHGLLEPQRSEGGHREYTEADRRVIERVLGLLEEGRSIGEIARMGRARILAGARPDVLSRSAAAVPEALRDRLVDAAVHLDEREIQRVLDDAFALASPLAAVEGVIVPAARLVGDLWASGRLSVASEHLLSAVLRFRLQKLVELASVGPRIGAPVICACLPEETHELGLLVLALNLAGRGRRVSYLGAALPVEDLDRAIEGLEPSAVCLSVTRSTTFERHARDVAFVARRHPEVVFWIGGPGVPPRSEPLARARVRIWSNNRSLPEFVEVVDARRAT